MKLQTTKTKSTQQSQLITGANREIEGLSLLNQYKGSMVEIDFINLDDTCTTDSRFVTDLMIIHTSTYLTLDDNVDDILAIRILREQILEIEEVYTDKIIIYTIKGTVIINRL